MKFLGVRHKNLTVCLSQNIVLSKHETFPGTSVIDITKTSFSHNAKQNAVLLYCSPSSFLATLYNILENLLSEPSDLVLGDFNIDILNSTNINLQISFLIMHC